jgi:hypothetical protein
MIGLLPYHAAKGDKLLRHWLQVIQPPLPKYKGLQSCILVQPGSVDTCHLRQAAAIKVTYV